MLIAMKKFGDVLTSRSDGREALMAIHALLPSHVPDDLDQSEDIVLDFEGISVLAPSFADEFVTTLVLLYPKKIHFRNTGNITVQKTLSFLSRKWPGGVYFTNEKK